MTVKTFCDSSSDNSNTESKTNLSVKWIINHFVATQPLGGVNSGDLQSIIPSLKIAESCLDLPGHSQ